MPQESGSVDSGACQDVNVVEVVMIMQCNRVTQGYGASRSEGDVRMRLRLVGPGRGVLTRHFDMTIILEHSTVGLPK